MNMAARLRAARIGRETLTKRGPRVVGTCGRNRDGSPIRIYADGSDDYCGEDDLTERAIENANDAYASMQTALDEGWGR